MRKSLPSPTFRPMDYQTRFLYSLQPQLKPGVSLVSAVADALGISQSVAYKKIRGESHLTLSQIEQLCECYNSSFYMTGTGNRTVATVSFTPFAAASVSVTQYLNSLQQFLMHLAAQKNLLLSCATDDIPLFHLFAYPELTAFKLHYWQFRMAKDAPMVLRMQDWSEQKLKSARNLHALYGKVASSEIWTRSSLLNTVQQIRHSAESGIVTDKGLGRLVCEQLKLALTDIEALAVDEHKSDTSVRFEWMFYDIIGSITYLAESEAGMETFIRFNTFNTLHEVNGPLCTEVKHWMQTLKRDSTGFSGQGSLHRRRYMQEAFSAIDEAMLLFR